jgi:acyl-CoA thioesterase
MPTPKLARKPRRHASGTQPPARRADGAPPPAPTPAFLRRFFRRDRFAAGAGIRLVDCGPGRAVARLTLDAGHMNGVDVAQGGAIFTLADFAFAVACNTRGPVALAIDVSISFLAATSRGTLTATAVEVSRSARLSRVEVTVKEARGATVALFHGTAYVTRDSIHQVAARAATPRRRVRVRR